MSVRGGESSSSRTDVLILVSSGFSKLVYHVVDWLVQQDDEEIDEEQNEDG